MEKHKKKRKREDEYIKSFEDNERPVLLIQQKHVYGGVDTAAPDENDYFKVTTKGEPIADIDAEILEQEGFIKRLTVKHGHQAQEPDDPGNVYKIEGIEFLPEGFIELDPLLYMDEYTFDNVVFEHFFAEDQKKTKEIRRKQYEQRHQNKMRDVTIYVVDKNRDLMLDFLDEWYFRNKRRMNEEEIEENAAKLNVDPVKLKRLQDLLLEKKRITNTNKLNNYLKKRNSNAIPNSLRKYFVKSNRQNKAPMLEKTKSPYDKKYLNKYGMKKLKKPFSKRIYVPGEQREEIKQPGFVKDEGVNSKTAPVEFVKYNQPDEKQSERSVRQLKDEIAKKSFKKVERPPEDIKELKNYFSKEINNIFDKIKGYKEEEEKSKSESEKEEEKEQSEEEEIKSESDKKEELKDHIEEQIQNLDQEDVGRTKKTLSLSRFIPLEDYQRINEEQQNMGEIKRNTIVMSSNNGECVVYQKLRPTLIMNKYYFLTIEELIDQEGNRRVSLITKNENGDLLFEREIPDELVTEYYESLIRMEDVDEDDEDEEDFEEDKDKQKRRITLVVNNNKGEEILNKEIEIVRFTEIGDKHYNEIIRNCDLENEIKTSVTVVPVEEEYRRTITMKPLLIGGEYYQQVIEEIIKDDRTTQTTIKIKKENGKTLAEDSLELDEMSTAYYTEIINDVVDPQGQRQVTIGLKNRESEVLREYKLNPLIYDNIQNEHLDTMVDNIMEEVVDKEGNKRLTLINKNDKGENIIYQEFRPVKVSQPENRERTQSKLRPTVIGNEHYDAAIDEIMENLSNRRTTTSNRLRHSSAISKKVDDDNDIKQGFVIDYVERRTNSVSRPTYIGNNHYVEIVDEIIEEEEDDIKSKASESKKQSKKGSKKVFPYLKQNKTVTYSNSNRYLSNGSKKNGKITSNRYLPGRQTDSRRNLKEKNKSLRKNKSYSQSNRYLKNVEESDKDKDQEDDDHIEEEEENKSNFENSNKDLILITKKSHVQPSKLSDSNYNSFKNEVIKNRSESSVLRPTIVGENYYGVIINEMLQHESNLKCLNKKESNTSELPEHLANNYYANLVNEVEQHRKKLLMGQQLNKIYNDSIEEKLPQDFKELESMKDIKIVFADDQIDLTEIARTGKEEEKQKNLEEVEAIYINEKDNEDNTNEDEEEVKSEKIESDKGEEIKKEESDKEEKIKSKKKESENEEENKKEESKKEESKKESVNIFNSRYETEDNQHISEGKPDENDIIEEQNINMNEVSQESQLVDDDEVFQNDSIMLDDMQNEQLVKKMKELINKRRSNTLNDKEKMILSSVCEDIIDDKAEEEIQAQQKEIKKQKRKKTKKADIINIVEGDDSERNLLHSSVVRDYLVTYEDLRDQYLNNKVEELIKKKRERIITISEKQLLDELTRKLLDEDIKNYLDDVDKELVEEYIKKESEKDLVEESEVINKEITIKETTVDEIKEAPEREESGMNEETVDLIESKIQDMRNDKEMMNEFERFCKTALPNDKKYQNSVLILSMFYHFLDKKKMLKRKQ